MIWRINSQRCSWVWARTLQATGVYRFHSLKHCRGNSLLPPKVSRSCARCLQLPLCKKIAFRAQVHILADCGWTGTG